MYKRGDFIQRFFVFLFVMFTARELLKKSIVYYHECYVNQKPVDWYAYSRICAWAAYDWIFNSLTREERVSIGKFFLNAVEQVQPTYKRHYFFPQENWSGYTTGFYGNRSLLWNTGLATYGERVGDSSFGVRETKTSLEENGGATTPSV